MADLAIVTEGLSRRFGRGADTTVALDGLTLEVPRGEVLGLLGHNGAGKTTSVRLLNGVLHPSGGRARVLGLDPVRDGPALRQRSGVLTETPALDERLDARESLLGFGRIFGLPEPDARARTARLLEDFGLADRAREPVRGFSKGMKQRLALARTLLHEPELLFLDEPTSGLDPVAARDVHDRIVQLTSDEGRTVVLCTHNLVEAQRLCQRVAVLNHGRLLALGTPAELAGRLAVRQRIRLDIAPEAHEAAVATCRRLEPDAAVRADDAPSRLLVEGVDRRRVPDLLAGLVAAGVPLFAVVPEAPDLEDVYFALLGDAAAGEAAPGAVAQGAVAHDAVVHDAVVHDAVGQDGVAEGSDAPSAGAPSTTDGNA